jgi:hypothetical protein
MLRRKLWLVLVAALTVVAVAAGIAVAEKDKGNNENFEYAIGLWGDFPYSDVQAQVGVPNLIDDMNDADIKFSVQDGDLKAGSATANSQTPTTCADPLYVQALGFFNSLKKPAFFTPGDNDWTDCDRLSSGPFDSLERLTHERTVFFSGKYADRSLGQEQMKAEVQTAPLCQGAPNSPGDPRPLVGCIENRLWTFQKVTYPQRAGHVQQPLQERLGGRPVGGRLERRSGRVPGAERRGHGVAAGGVRRGRRQEVGRPDDHLAGRSGLRHLRLPGNAQA